MRLIGLAVLLTLLGGAQASAQVVALGDSATKGFHLPESAAWPFKLEALLRQRGLDVSVANQGVNGDTSDGMLSRLDSAVPEGTRLVIFACCGNDNKDERHLVADHDGNMRAIFARLRARGVAVIFSSDPDAALYYLARMLEAGEDPLFLARRVVRMASEDVGLADPQALVVANAAKDAYDFLGSPEGELAIAEAVVYVAAAPKSNALYTAFQAASDLAKSHGSLVPPKTILNAPTRLMRAEGYGADYLYDHDQPDAFSGQNYWPEALGRRKLYEPVERGFEREIRKRLEYWAKLRRERGEG